MPESETFKLIVQGGSFALMVLFFVWLLFKAEPNYRKTVETIVAETARAVERQAADNRAAMEKVASDERAKMEKLATEHRAAMEAVNATHQKTIETLTRTFEVTLANQLKECREERREMTNTMISAIKTEGELNRENRHEANNTLQKAIAEVYKGNARRTRPNAQSQSDQQTQPEE